MKSTITNLAQRQIKELTDLPAEFTLGDIGDLFEKQGYDRKKIVRNASLLIISMLCYYRKK